MGRRSHSEDVRPRALRTGAHNSPTRTLSVLEVFDEEAQPGATGTCPRPWGQDLGEAVLAVAVRPPVQGWFLYTRGGQAMAHGPNPAAPFGAAPQPPAVRLLFLHSF